MLEHPPGPSAPQARDKDKARAEMQPSSSGQTQSGQFCKPPATRLAKHTDVPSSSCRTGAAQETAVCVQLMVKASEILHSSSVPRSQGRPPVPSGVAKPSAAGARPSGAVALPFLSTLTAPGCTAQVPPVPYPRGKSGAKTSPPDWFFNHTSLLKL